MINVETSNTPLEDGARALKKTLLQHADKDILLLFSGGSSLALVDRIHPDIVSTRCTISVFDERYTFEKNESNFELLSKTQFFSYATEHGTAYIDPRPKEGESVEDAGNRFDRALKEWHITHRDGVVIATVGIGSDGHTAGILPMTEDPDTFKKLFLSEARCAVGYQLSPDINPHTKRITVTLTYIKRHLMHAIIYASGTQKRDALVAIRNGGTDYEHLPAKMLHEVPHASLFTDISLR